MELSQPDAVKPAAVCGEAGGGDALEMSEVN